MRPALADTGAIVALLSGSDPWHAACVASIRDLRLPLLTTWPVLTEVFHFTLPRGRAATWLLVHRALQVSEPEPSSAARIEALMARYADRPMDLADASLVELAERSRVTSVFTIDHADFETYRIGGRKSFDIVPLRRLPQV